MNETPAAEKDARRSVAYPDWGVLMSEPRLSIPLPRFRDAVGWAEARASERVQRQKIRREDVNGVAYWVIRDVAA